jgi:hypothetical protein
MNARAAEIRLGLDRRIEIEMKRFMTRLPADGLAVTVTPKDSVSEHRLRHDLGEWCRHVERAVFGHVGRKLMLRLPRAFIAEGERNGLVRLHAHGFVAIPRTSETGSFAALCKTKWLRLPSAAAECQFEPMRSARWIDYMLKLRTKPFAQLSEALITEATWLP